MYLCFVCEAFGALEGEVLDGFFKVLDESFLSLLYVLWGVGIEDL